LEHLGVEYTQQQKYDTLLKNFLCESTAGLVEILRNQHKDSKTPFEDACDHLLDHHDIAKWNDDQQRIINPAMGPRRAQMVHNVDEEDRNQPVEERTVAYGQQKNDDLRIPDAWWKGATEEEQETLRQMRTKIKARLQAKREYPVNLRTGTSNQPQDGNHSKVHAQQATSTIFPEDSDDDEDSAVEQLGLIELKMRDVFGGMARTSE
jgi:hypothetical protein